MKKITILAIFNLILLIFIFGIATFAWFSTNRETSGKGLLITAQQNEIGFNYTVYKYDDENKVFITTNSFNLRPYDMIITNRNLHSSLVLKLDIYGDFIIQGRDIYLNFLCSDGQSTTMSLSNAVHFKIGMLSIVSDDAAFVYTEVERQLNSSSSIKFSNAQKSQTISHLLRNYNATNGILTVYIQIDYDVDLLENFETITNDDFDAPINFAADIYELNIVAGD